MRGHLNIKCLYETELTALQYNFKMCVFVCACACACVSVGTCEEPDEDHEEKQYGWLLIL